MKANLLFSVISCSVLLVTPYAYSQGPLTPPGAPAPTMKTLDQIASTGIAVNAVNTPGNSANQFIISSPGSYYLTTNITGVSGKNGILINNINVTLDLNGFNVLGVPGSLNGITDGGGNSGNVTVRNGTVRAWGQAGITLTASFDMLVENVISADNGGVGINLGDAAVARDCMARNNTSNNIAAGFNANLFHCTGVGGTTVNGISVTQDGVLNGCVANFNSLEGIMTGPGCVLTSCSAAQNSGVGISTGGNSILTSCLSFQNTTSGIVANANSTLTSCTSSGNGLFGISCGSNCVLQACAATGNTGGGVTIGIFASYGSALTGCSASGNAVQYGIVANPGSTITHCAASWNTSTQPFSAGILAAGCTIKDCTAVGNTGSVATNTCGMGIYSNGSQGQIQNCTASGNKGDNIYSLGGCKMTGNMCDSGSAAGLHASGGGNVVEGNDCSFNQTGVLVDATVNLVFRNTARGNSTNYSIVAGNRVGTIVIPATNSAISGNSGGTTFTNDSFSNIAF